MSVTCHEPSHRSHRQAQDRDVFCSAVLPAQSLDLAPIRRRLSGRLRRSGAVAPQAIHDIVTAVRYGLAHGGEPHPLLGAPETLIRDKVDAVRRTGAHTGVLSAEGFSSPTPKFSEAFGRALADRDFEATVVCFLRRQDLWVESHYQQMVMNRALTDMDVALALGPGAAQSLGSGGDCGVDPTGQCRRPRHRELQGAAIAVPVSPPPLRISVSGRPKIHPKTLHCQQRGNPRPVLPKPIPRTLCPHHSTPPRSRSHMGRFSARFRRSAHRQGVPPRLRFLAAVRKGFPKGSLCSGGERAGHIAAAA